MEEQLGDQTGFTIQRQNEDESWSDVGTAGANATSFSDGGLISNTDYPYRIIATGETRFIPSWQGIGATDLGDGIVYEGGPGSPDGGQTYDGVTAELEFGK